MKNIFQKTAKFISSRLLYLVIGIFLAIGATYVYATWDQAKTGGSGQLTEANWNELVTMIENNISSRVDNAYSASFPILPYDSDDGDAAYGRIACSNTACPSGWVSITTFQYIIEDFCDTSRYSCSENSIKKLCTATVCGLPR